MNARQIIETVLVSEQIQDMALNFVEHALGTNRFPDNWMGLAEGKITRVQQWLDEVQSDACAAEIVTVLNRMAEEGVRWKPPLFFKTAKLPKAPKKE